PPGQGPPQGDPECVEIGLMGGLLSGEDLGSHEQRRARALRRLVSGGLRPPAKPEIGQHRPILPLEEYVRRLDVAVHQSGRVQSLEREQSWMPMSATWSGRSGPTRSISRDRLVPGTHSIHMPTRPWSSAIPYTVTTLG